MSASSLLQAPLRPRVVDWALLGAVLAAWLSGLALLLAGSPGWRWLAPLHAGVGYLLLPLLGWKLARVARRLRHVGRPSVAFSAFLVPLTLLAMATGAGWTLGLLPLHWVAGYTGMNIHIVLGLGLPALTGLHALLRARPLRPRDRPGRRAVLRALSAGMALWLPVRLLEDGRRFTGSKDAGGTGNRFPVTNWWADPFPRVDPHAYRLEVRGRQEVGLGYPHLLAFDDRLEAVLDCTGGWYAHRTWQGVRVGRLLDRVGLPAGATGVRFRSVTGYRFSLPLVEARQALLATHVDGEPLSPGHGFPVRLVAAGRRGFQWVKWVVAVEAFRGTDAGQWGAIFASGYRKG